MKEIIDSIKEKLTDNNEDNIQMLLKEMDNYKGNDEVTKAIYKMLYECLPKDLQDNFVRNINQEKFEERIKGVQELLVLKDYEKALSFLDFTIDKLEQAHEDDEYVYMTFHSAFEAYFYAYNRDEKEAKLIKNAQMDFGVYYKFRGIVLYELGRFADAEEAYIESLKWNPLDFEAIFGYADTLYALKKYEQFLELNLDTIDKAFTPYAIASCYHNIGKYYLTKGSKANDMIAFNIICYSIAFAETNYAYKDLDDICVKYNMERKLAPNKDLFETLKRVKIQTAPSEKLVKQLIDIARSFIGKQDQFALEVFRLIYKLTHDEITLQYIKAGEKAIANAKKQN